MPSGEGVHELDHAVGLGIGERLEQDGVDDGEDGGVGSDAEGEGGDGGDGEGRVRDEHAEGIFEVVPEIAHDFAILQRGHRRFSETVEARGMPACRVSEKSRCISDVRSVQKKCAKSAKSVKSPY